MQNTSLPSHVTRKSPANCQNAIVWVETAQTRNLKFKR